MSVFDDRHATRNPAKNPAADFESIYSDALPCIAKAGELGMRLRHTDQGSIVRSSAWVCGLTILCTTTLACAQDSAEAVVKKRFEALARHDLDAIVALYASNAVETSPGFCAARQGPDGARRTYGDLLRDAPGIEDEVTRWVVDGDHVAVQFVARVRKADGSVAFELPLANFLTVEHGRIVRDDTYYDTKGRPCK